MRPGTTNIHIIRYEEVDSTNRIAFDLGDQGAQHGTVVTASCQTGGRGRQGRSFFSPPGGLYFSLILRPEGQEEYFHLLTLAVGVICARKLEQVSGLEVMLKWPNDLYLRKRKLGGILSEAAPYSHEEGGVPFIVVGIGLNINTAKEKFPELLKDSAVSLSAVQSRKFDLDQIMIDIAEGIDQYSRTSQLMKDEMLKEWRRRDYLMGRRICWQASDSVRKYGIGAGLMADGRYQLQTANGEISPILGGELRIIDTDPHDNVNS